MNSRSSSASESCARFSLRRLLYLLTGFALVAGVALAEHKPASSDVRPQSQKGSVLISFTKGRLSVNVENASLAHMLRKVATETDLALVLSGHLEDPVTIAFDRLPLERALRQILRNRNFALEYRTGRPSKLWVFAKGEPGSRTPAQAVVDVKAGRLQPSLASPDPTERGAAVEALAEVGGEDAIRRLQVVLRDPNEEVRETAIAALAEIGSDDAAAALAVALRDEEPWLREVAAMALGDIGGDSAVRLLRQALLDQDESIREIAADALTQLDH